MAAGATADQKQLADKSDAEEVLTVNHSFINTVKKLHFAMKSTSLVGLPLLIYLSRKKKLLMITLILLDVSVFGLYYAHNEFFSLQITHMRLTADRRHAVLRLGTAAADSELTVDISKIVCGADQGPNEELAGKVEHEGVERNFVLMGSQEYTDMVTSIANYDLARHVMKGDLQQVQRYKFKRN